MAFAPNGLLAVRSTKSDFASNGLLGNPLKPNGLLGSSGDKEKETPDDDVRIGSSTAPGPHSTSEPSDETPAGSDMLLHADTEFDSTEHGPPSSPAFASNRCPDTSTRESFKANGLLSGNTRSSPTTSSFGTPSLLTQPSQDESFPEVADLLRPYSTSNRERVGGSSTRALPTHLERMPVRATTYEGRTLFMKRRTRVDLGVKDTSRMSSASIGKILDVPIHRLMDQLSAETAAKLSLPAPASASGSNIRTEDMLWVDRYRPRRFTDLLGNERVAREAMSWVKQWDWCVFGTAKAKAKARAKKRPREGEENFGYEDEYHRPKERLLLVSGPAGLGKTTLAHVIAKQAGYEVMEINASDARTGQIVDDRIQPALESGSAVGSTKPVLIIIDEIDGATGGGDNSSGFVHKLIQLTFDKPRKKGRGKQARDPNAKRPLLRPIICICNDPFAASLAKLRPHTLHLRFQRPTDIQLVKRLREICDIEGLNAEGRALSTLVGVAKGDLRGCLNTLQFIKARNETVTEPIIRKATVGMKEADTSVITVLNDLFAPMTKKRVKELGIGGEEETKYVGRLSQEVEGCDQSSKVALGCFAQYPNLKRHDATFERYEKANEWLGTYDLLSGAMYSGDFGLVAYLPYTLVPFFPLFQERGNPRVERSQADWEHHLATRMNEEIYKSLSRCLRAASARQAGAYRHMASGQVLQLEFAPFINRIISPPLRPVNSQVIRPVERALLARLVSIMAALELNFVQERAEDGQLVYRLNPPIDVFVTYDGKRASDIAVSRYAVRHLVAGEIEAMMIQNQADAVEKGKTRKLDYFGTRGNKAQENEVEDSATKAVDGVDTEPPSKRARKDLRDIADKPPVDFFGRLITVPSASSTKAAARKNVEGKYRVTYRYTEGNSAAVRKPIKTGAFL